MSVTLIGNEILPLVAVTVIVLIPTGVPPPPEPPPLVPVPLRATVCGLPAPLSEIVSVPVCAPVAVGSNVTCIVQLAPLATVAPQLFDAPNWPEAVMLDTLRVPVPVFVSVTFCAVLIVLRFWLVKARVDGDKLTKGVGVELDVPLELPPHAAAINRNPKAIDPGTILHLR